MPEILKEDPSHFWAMVDARRSELVANIFESGMTMDDIDADTEATRAIAEKLTKNEKLGDKDHEKLQTLRNDYLGRRRELKALTDGIKSNKAEFMERIAEYSPEWAKFASYHGKEKAAEVLLSALESNAFTSKGNFNEIAEKFKNFEDLKKTENALDGRIQEIAAKYQISAASIKRLYEENPKPRDFATGLSALAHRDGNRTWFSRIFGEYFVDDVRKKLEAASREAGKTLGNGGEAVLNFVEGDKDAMDVLNDLTRKTRFESDASRQMKLKDAQAMYKAEKGNNTEPDVDAVKHAMLEFYYENEWENDRLMDGDELDQFTMYYANRFPSGAMNQARKTAGLFGGISEKLMDEFWRSKVIEVILDDDELQEHLQEDVRN